MGASPKHPDRHIRRRIVLQSAAALAVGGPAILAGTTERACADQGKELFAYVGAFTTPQRKGHGDGINVYHVDPRTGGWTHVQLVPNLVNPSFLALDHQQRFLYSVHADLDEVSAYAIDKDSGQLTPLNRQSCGGKNPVHLAIDPSNRFILTANYGAGSVAVVPIEKDGTLGARTDLASLPGEPGPNRKEQASSHPHDCPFDPVGHFILVPDKGLDRVFVFWLDANGKLMPNNPPFVATREGAGPRHIAFHPIMGYAYVIDELDSTVTTYRYHGGGGTLQPVQVVPSTPASFTGNNTGAEIAVAPSGHFIYASNRGDDSIAIFAVDPAGGTLTPVGWEPTQGKTPRFFGLDPAANFLYAANQDSDTIVTFRIDQATGKLTPTGQVIKVGSPCTIVFAGA